MPGSFWRGRNLVLRAKGQLDTAAAKPMKVRSRPIPRKARRFGRSPGSY